MIIQNHIPNLPIPSLPVVLFRLHLIHRFSISDTKIGEPVICGLKSEWGRENEMKTEVQFWQYVSIQFICSRSLNSSDKLSTSTGIDSGPNPSFKKLSSDPVFSLNTLTPPSVSNDNDFFLMTSYSISALISGFFSASSPTRPHYWTLSRHNQLISWQNFP